MRCHKTSKQKYQVESKIQKNEAQEKSLAWRNYLENMGKKIGKKINEEVEKILDHKVSQPEEKMFKNYGSKLFQGC